MSESHSTASLRVGRVPGYPNYRVLSNGSVYQKRGDTWIKLKPSLNRHGYQFVFLRTKRHFSSQFVHRLVLTAFVGPRPDGMVCRHLDGNKLNNRLENLQWGTYTENEHDKLKHGIRKDKRYKLNAYDVQEIRRRSANETRKALAREFGVTPITIYYVATRQRWKHLP